MDSTVEDVSVSEVVEEDVGGAFEQNAMEEAYSQEDVSDDERKPELVVEDNSSAEAVSGSKEDAVDTEESTILTEQGDDTQKKEAPTSGTPVVEEPTMQEPSTQEPTTQAPVTEETERDDSSS